jgi:hypothetical protein
MITNINTGSGEDTRASKRLESDGAPGVILNALVIASVAKIEATAVVMIIMVVARTAVSRAIIASPTVISSFRDVVVLPLFGQCLGRRIGANLARARLGPLTQGLKRWFFTRSRRAELECSNGELMFTCLPRLLRPKSARP